MTLLTLSLMTGKKNGVVFTPQVARKKPGNLPKESILLSENKKLSENEVPSFKKLHSQNGLYAFLTAYEAKDGARSRTLKDGALFNELQARNDRCTEIEPRNKRVVVKHYINSKGAVYG